MNGQNRYKTNRTRKPYEPTTRPAKSLIPKPHTRRKLRDLIKHLEVKLCRFAWVSVEAIRAKDAAELSALKLNGDPNTGRKLIKKIIELRKRIEAMPKGDT